MAMLQLRCWKASKFYKIDLNKVPDRVYKEALILGFRELLNRGMSALHNEKANVYEAKAQENIDKIMTGDIRFSKSA